MTSFIGLAGILVFLAWLCMFRIELSYSPRPWLRLSVRVFGLILVLYLSVLLLFESIKTLQKHEGGFEIMSLEVAFTKDEINAGLLLFAAMLIGMLFRYFFYVWSRGKPILFRELMQGIFISPLVFGVVWGSTSHDTLTIQSLLFSFENGFFWPTIVSEVKKRRLKGSLLTGQ